MWTEKTFDLTRREIRTSRPFDQVVAAIEARAPVVVLETNHQLLGQDTIDAISAGRLDSAELRRRVIERQPDGKMRVTSGSWDGGKVLFAELRSAASHNCSKKTFCTNSH
jgi:hypothetical protein